MEAKDDPRVKAIRENKLVGKGTCSSIDECYTDEEIVEQLDTMEITTPLSAVTYMINSEEAYIEHALNARWGEDDDPQLKHYREFKEAKRKYIEEIVEKHLG